jgi:hypothetical protein
MVAKTEPQVLMVAKREPQVLVMAEREPQGLMVVKRPRWRPKCRLCPKGIPRDWCWPRVSPRIRQVLVVVSYSERKVEMVA